MTPPTITATQRDLLYEHIMMRLTALNDIAIAVEHGRFEQADRLSIEFADYLRLLHDDLGWGAGAGRPIELETPEDVLRRAFARVKAQAEELIRQDAEEGAERHARQERNQSMWETCGRVLAELDD